LSQDIEIVDYFDVTSTYR